MRALEIKHRLRAFLRDRCGAILPEFAIALPVLVLLILGGAELSRYLLLTQKVNRAAATMGDLTAQAISLTEQSLTDIYDSVEHVMTPFALSNKGVIIVSSVSRPAAPSTDPPTVDWQRCGGGTLNVASRVGIPNGNADFSFMTTPFVVPPGSNVIVAEIFYNYEPEFDVSMSQVFDDNVPQGKANILGAHQMYDIVIYTPRIVPLNTITPGGTASTCP